MNSKKKIIKELIRKDFPNLTDKQIYSYVMGGCFKVNGETVRSLTQKFTEKSEIKLKLNNFVSRGGNKLQGAFDAWEIDVRNKIMLDAGCSTGGFTDCLLKNGAASVHAVDVGYNQLDYNLRMNDKIFVHEKTNIMKIENLNPRPTAAVADLSFRSIVQAADRILTLSGNNWLIALIKPQFEIIEPIEGFHGVLKDKAMIKDVLVRVCADLSEVGIACKKIIPSPLKGKKGNQEFLVYMDRLLEGYHVKEIINRIENLDF